MQARFDENETDWALFYVEKYIWIINMKRSRAFLFFFFSWNKTSASGEFRRRYGIESQGNMFIWREAIILYSAEKFFERYAVNNVSNASR